MTYVASMIRKSLNSGRLSELETMTSALPKITTMSATPETILPTFGFLASKGNTRPSLNGRTRIIQRRIAIGRVLPGDYAGESALQAVGSGIVFFT